MGISTWAPSQTIKSTGKVVTFITLETCIRVFSNRITRRVLEFSVLGTGISIRGCGIRG